MAAGIAFRRAAKRAAATLFVSAVRKGAAFGASGVAVTVSSFDAADVGVTALFGATELLAGMDVSTGCPAFGVGCARTSASATSTAFLAGADAFTAVFGFSATLPDASSLPPDVFFAGVVAAFAATLMWFAGATAFAAALVAVVPAFTIAPVFPTGWAVAFLVVAVLVAGVLVAGVLVVGVVAGLLAEWAPVADRADARAPCAAGLLVVVTFSVDFAAVDFADATLVAVPLSAGTGLAFVGLAGFIAATVLAATVLPATLLAATLLAATFLSECVFA